MIVGDIGFTNIDESFLINLTAEGWSNKNQTINNEKFLSEGYVYMVSPIGDDIEKYSKSGIYADDVTVNGQITFHCKMAPSDTMTVNVLKSEVKNGQ